MINLKDKKVSSRGKSVSFATGSTIPMATPSVTGSPIPGAMRMATSSLIPGATSSATSFGTTGSATSSVTPMATSSVTPIATRRVKFSKDPNINTNVLATIIPFKKTKPILKSTTKPNVTSGSTSASKTKKLKKKLHNINSYNVNPFIEKIDFKISDILSNKNAGLPLIPGIYFVQKSNANPDYITHPLSNNKDDKIYGYDNIGTEAITKYYNIKNSLYKLETIKNFIISIININKKLFETIKISQKKYNLIKGNVFFNFKEKLYDNFISIFGSSEGNISKLTKTKDKDNSSSYKDKNVSKITIYVLIRALVKNNYNLLKKMKKSSNPKDPYFMYIFQNESNKKSKSYFYKLFQEYKKERTNLIKYILNDYGILAFHFIFDLKYKLTKPDITINPNENIENYKIINKETNVNSNKETNVNSNNDYNVGDILYNRSKDKSNKIIYGKEYGYIYNIDYRLSKPYTIKLKNPNNEQFAYLSISDMLKYIKKNKIKPTLQKKINNFNLLYKNLISNDSIISDYKNNINTIYSNFYKSLNNYLNENPEYSLYDVIKNNLDLEINLFKFIFNYVDIGIFNRAVEINTNIKTYIDNRIMDFESKYESYILLFNTINKIISNDNFYNNNLSSLDFSNFLTNLITKLDEGNINNNNSIDNFIIKFKDKLKELVSIYDPSGTHTLKTFINSFNNKLLITPKFIGVLKTKLNNISKTI